MKPTTNSFVPKKGKKYTMDCWEKDWWIQCLYIDPGLRYWLGEGNDKNPVLINFRADWIEIVNPIQAKGMKEL